MSNGPPPPEPTLPEHEIGPQPSRRKPEVTIPLMRPRERLIAGGSPWDAWAPLLNNRLILSGLGLVVVLLLIAIVLVSIGHGSEATNRSLIAIPTGSAASGTALTRGSVSARVLTTTPLRNGPHASYSILGTLPKGASVAVVGRNEDESWVQIRYPPGSNLRGWVDAHSLQINGDIAQLAVEGPGPAPAVALPTQPAGITVASPTEEEATPTPADETPAITSTPATIEKATPTPEPTSTPPKPTPPSGG